jgi:hypothetical protein
MTIREPTTGGVPLTVTEVEPAVFPAVIVPEAPNLPCVPISKTACDPFDVMIVATSPLPRSVTFEGIVIVEETLYVPAASNTVWPAGQEFSALWIEPALETVWKIVVLTGIPPAR